MNIVVLDGYTLNPGDNPWDDLSRLGTLTVYDRTPVERIVERATGARVLLTNKTPLPADVLERLPELRFITVLATGYDIVDVAAARGRGVLVANVPEYGTDSVAQHVFALLFELCHQVALHDAAVKAGEWTKVEDFSFWKRAPLELVGSSMGIVGFGRIGKRVATLARAFGMKVMATSLLREELGNEPVIWEEMGELFSQADVVSLHCPLTPENAKFVKRGLLASMKRTAFLINTARGGLVDEQALADALNQGELAGAAVDVVSVEPMTPDNPLLHAPNCIVTPHMAWGSLAARRRLMRTTAANVEGFLAGRPVNVVN